MGSYHYVPSRGERKLAAEREEIKLTQAPPDKRSDKEEVRIIWQGDRIARVIFKSGKVVEFQN